MIIRQAVRPLPPKGGDAYANYSYVTCLRTHCTYLPQLAGSCIKENQDLISEILEKLFVFSSVYLTGSGSSLLFVIVMMLLFGDRIAYTQYTKVRQVLQAESAFSDSRRNTGPYRQNMLSCS